MKTTPLIDRLKAQVAAFGARVAGTATLEGAAETDLAVPHAFVVPQGDQTEPDEMAGGATVQIIRELFGVIVAVANVSDERGQTAGDQIDDLRVALVAALEGFRPDPRYAPLEYYGSSYIESDRARLWWQFDFVTTTQSDLILS
jgi:hypothetical protein